MARPERTGVSLPKSDGAPPIPKLGRITPLPSPGPANPIPALDAVRVLGALLVVAFHTPGLGGRLATSAGGAMFLLTTFGLSSLRQGDEPLLLFARRRAARFLLPFAVWSLVYLAWRFRHAVVDTDPWPTLFTPAAFCAGFSYQLWYLPFAFAGCVISWPIVRATRRIPDFAAIALTSGVGFLLFGAIRRAIGNAEMTLPWGQWLCSAPGILVGVGFARLHAIQNERRKRIAAVAVSLLTLSVATWLFAQGLVVTTIAAAIAEPIVCAAFVLELPSRPPLAWLSRRTLGIYVLHPLVSDVWMKVLGLDVAPPLLFALTYAGSIAATEGIRRVPRARWIV
jgi:peptidoglycan/LPS O-acetylase OafA/YrhL